MFQHTLIVRGKAQDLDEIVRRLSFTVDRGEITKHSDPGDAPLTDTNIRHLSNHKEGSVNVGTTRLEIGYNGDKEKLKQDILLRFPKVMVE